jgi:cytochrome P450
MFVFIMAGYKTSACTLIYALILLACHSNFQAQLHGELDQNLGTRELYDFSYDTDMPQLVDGYVGAVFDENLRLYPPLPFAPKTTEAASKTIHIGDENFLVPANTLCPMNTNATHMNPKYWPELSHKVADGPPYPVSKF